MPQSHSARQEICHGIFQLQRLVVGQRRICGGGNDCTPTISLQPNNAEAYNNLATILRRQGRLRDTEAAFHRALELDPDYEEARGNLIFLRDFNTGLSLEEEQKDRREWAERFVDSLSVHWKPHENEKSPDRRLRIGYVSGDFQNHSAAITFGAELLERDRQEFEVFCYRTSARRDAITEKPENNADAWLPCWGLTDVDLDVLLRADKIDILANLAGHSAGNRIPALARTHSNHRLGPLRRERHESDGLHPSRSRYHAAGGCQALCRERRGIVLRAEFVPP